jgi:hypothetical protein
VKRKRPIGISILAWLHIVASLIAALVIILVIFSKWNEADDIIRATGIPLWLIIAGVGVILGLGIGSGIGMLKGKAWGWYLGSFYYLYSVIRNANALWFVTSTLNTMPLEEIESLSHSPSYYYMKYGGRILIHALLYLYFFKSNVREYFELKHQKMWKPIAVQFGICIAIAIAFSLIMAMPH